MEQNKKSCIIIDNGTGLCKAGFGGEKEPKIVFSTCVGTPKYPVGFIGGNNKNIFIGAAAEKKRGLLNINNPIQGGLITNWDNMEKIWDDLFTNGLKVAPEEHFVLLSEVPLNPEKNREKMAQIMFEKFKVAGLYIENQAILAASGLGIYTGMVLNSGDGVTNCIPILDGLEISDAYFSSDVAGKELTEYMVQLMAETGKRFTTYAEKEIVKDIKEKTCYVALNFEDELKQVEPYDYELPDGSRIFIKDQRIRCPEALFNPSKIGKKGKGLGQVCFEAIDKCNKDLKKAFSNSIMLSGGNTMYQGFPERLKKEIKALVPQVMKEEVKIIDNPDRKFAAWKGGSIISTLSSFDNRWITKKQYEENGLCIIHKKLKQTTVESPIAISKDEVIPIYNPKLNLLPTLILSVDFDGKINEELYNNLKKELTETIGSNKFAITELRKGSAIMKIVLLGDLALNGIKASLYNSDSEEIDSILRRIESKKFVCLGNNHASDTKYITPDYRQNENRIQLVNFLNECNEDILQASATLTEKEFENILEKTLENVTDTLITQEINQKKYILNKLEEFNEEMESILEQAKKESIFEFGVSGLSLIERDTTTFKNNKDNCNNLITKFLFHGTSTDSSSKIVTSNFRNASVTYFGPGVYMTDMLDYAGFYAFTPNEYKFRNHRRIRNVDEIFNIVVSQVYYNESKFEKKFNRTNDPVPDEGIRYVNVNAFGSALSKDQTKENGYNKFIGTEYVIPSEKQILPLYSITLKRNEYFCLWKDYHFTHQTGFTEHALHVKNVAKQLLGINVYGVGEIDEALSILKRKKYNKVIIISNVGENIDIAKQFIKDIREILKFDVIILFFTSKTRHLDWIKEIPNILFTMRDAFFKKYILNFNESGLNELKNEIEDYYGTKLDKFQADLSYPLFQEANSKGRYDLIEID